MKKYKIFKRLKAVMCLTIILASIASIIPVRESYGLDYSGALGTNRAINVPLVNNEFVTDTWNKWDMQCFALFLSNFTQPFVDSYESAFTEGKGGSNGAGLSALQFAAGGDVDSTGALNQMVQWVLQTEKVTALKEVKVKLYAYDGNVVNGAVSTKTDARTATVRDLFITSCDNDDALDLGKKDWSEFADIYDVPFMFLTSALGIDSTTMKSEKISDLNYQYSLAIKSNIPVFFVGNYEESKKDKTDCKDIVWDMSDGWDCQMWAAILNYVYNGCNSKVAHGITGTEDMSDAGDNSTTTTDIQGGETTSLLGGEVKMSDFLQNTLKNCGDFPLYMDCFGNIGIKSGNNFVVVIPAVMNKNLTTDGRINLMVSPIINDYIDTSSDVLSMLISGTDEFTNGASDKTTNFGGSSITTVDGSSWGSYNMSSQKGKVLLYESTDYIGTNMFYESEFWTKEQSDWILKYDTDFASKFKQIMLGTHKTGINDVNLRIEVVGAGDQGFWDGWDGLATTEFDKIKSFKNIKLESVVVRNYQSCQVLSYMFPYGANETPLLDYIYNESGNKAKSSMLGGTIFASPGVGLSDNNGDASCGFIKYYLDYFFQVVTKGDKIINPFNNLTTSLNGTNMRKTLEGCTTMEQIASYIFSDTTNGKSIENKDTNDLLDYRLCFGSRFGLESKYYSQKYFEKVSDNTKWGSWDNDIDDDWINNFDWFGGSQLSSLSAYESLRGMAKVYTGETVLKKAANFLGLVDGTDFSASATWIYLTYLDFYGVLGTDGSGDSYFKESLFKSVIDAVKPEELFSGQYMTKEQKQEEVLNYSYLMLSPEAGRDYRNGIANTGLTDWVYTQYNKVCYGTSDADKYTNLLSTGAEGFLHIYSYEDNFLTSWVVENYSKVVMWGLLFVIILLIVYGLVKQLKIGWFVMSVITIVVMFVLAPSAGEITPFVCENIVNKMFSVGSNHWALSETIENITLEKNVDEEEDGSEVLTWVSMLRTSQMNKTILLKKDISKKIIEATTVDYTDLQKLKSTRWMLSSFMRQIRDDSSNYDYVYTTLAEQFQMATDTYLYYNSSDEAMNYGNHAIDIVDGKSTGLASELGYKTVELINKYKKPYTTSDSRYFLLDTRIESESANGWTAYDLPFSNTAYYKSSGGTEQDTYGMNKIHTIMYVLNSNTVGSDLKASAVSGYYVAGSKDYRSSWYSNVINISNKNRTTNYWDGYAMRVGAASTTTIDHFTSVTNGILKRIKNYNHNSKEDTSKFAQSFGYLMTTENLGCYFYSLVKDTFYEETSTKTLAYVISQLQGNAYKDDKGKVVRQSFMHYKDTGMTKDVLDLREVFTNVVPYMYQMQVNGLGTDNSNGLLKDKKFGEDYSIYSESEQGWLYRSNWVTKLMEAKDYSEAVTVKGYASYKIDSDGKFKGVGEKIDYVISAPLLPQSYPGSLVSFDGNTGIENASIQKGTTVKGYRPMIYSEAQMKMLGLKEADLSSVELACIEANRNTVKDWTLLINYANKSGVTKEAIYRMMSVTALLEFNKAFTPDNFISSSMNLYPTALDLRNISFDAVMKLLIMSNSNTATYTGASAIQTVIDDGGFWSGLLLLIAAVLCNSILPFIRTVVMGLIFYAGIVSALWNVVKSRREQGMMCGGTFLCHASICAATAAYYFIYYAFITVSSSDEVLSLTKITADTSIPNWKIFVIVFGSIIYLVFLIVFCWKLLHNIKDMGLGMFKKFGTAILNGVNNMANKASDGFKDLFNIDNSDNSTNSSSSSFDTHNSSEISNSEENPVNVRTVGDSNVNVTMNNNYDKDFGQETGDSGYVLDGGVGGANNVSDYNIDHVISEGRQMSETSSTNKESDSKTE